MQPASGDRATPWLVTGLGITQTIAWASSYYLLAIIADPLAEAVGTTPAWIFAALSLAILVSAVAGPLAGRLVDRDGGRAVLLASNLMFAAGLSVLALVDSLVGVIAAWLVLGIAMAFGLYEAAFATITAHRPLTARRAITMITLLGGLASTIGWPLTSLFEVAWGWRGACVAWAAIHLAIALPINFLSIPRARPAVSTGAGQADAPEQLAEPGPATEAARTAPKISRFAVMLVAFYFCLEWFISTGMAVHMPRLLEAQGLDHASAIAAAGLVGIAQSAARLTEYALFARVHPALLASFAASLHPLGALLLTLLAGVAAPLFTILHGIGNGLFTVARGTLPLTLFGASNYGLRLNLLMMPARIAQAASPFVLGLVIDLGADRALVLTAGLGLIAMLTTALIWRRDQNDAHTPRRRH